MSSLPTEHIEDVQSLTPDYPCDLFEITLLDNQGTIRIWNGVTSLWRGNQYEFLPCRIGKESETTDDTQNRPEFIFYNPDDQYTPYITEGYLEGATFTRKRVLAAHFKSDLNIFQRRVWKLVRVASMAPGVITAELRDLSAGPNQVVPARVFIPPDFPAVSL